jgi:subfamily B ATP-binding cassette protein MsbA
LRAYGWTLPLIIALGTLSSIAEAVGIGLFLPVLDPGYLAGRAPGTHTGTIPALLAKLSAIPGTSRVAVIVAVILAALILKAVIAYANAVLSARKNLELGHTLRCEVFSSLLNSGYAFVSRNDWGKLLDVLSTETWRSTQALAAAILAITSLCTLIVFSALLLLISWQLTLAVAIGMVVLSLAVRWISRPVKRHGEEAVRLNGKLGEHMVDGILGMRTVETFNLQNHLRNRFQHSSDEVRAAFLRVETWSSLVNPCADVSSSLFLLALVIVSAGSGTPWPVLVVTVMMIYRLQAPFKQLENSRVTWAGLSGASASVNELLERTAASSRRRPTSSVVRKLEREIRFQSVCFSYPNAADPSLQDVTVSIPRGQVTALVGLSGAGKTTFLNLLCGLYEPDTGAILVDGVPLTEIDSTAWRERLALAGQDIHLFNTTVHENIRYGRLTATDAEILDAARRAHADEFLSEFPNGYETLVGDNGGRLSGGQRQRIALARAFLRDPEILILDEATNALDSLSERWVQSALEELGEHRTVVIAAHRFSTIRHADQVIVLDGGRVVEQGSPASLRGRDGLFARLYQLQALEPLEDVA